LLMPHEVSMKSEDSTLEFVTIDGLLAFAERLVARPVPEHVAPPSAPPATSAASSDRRARAEAALSAIRSFVDRAAQGFPDAAGYRTARQGLIQQACHSDALVFYAAWNKLLADGDLTPLFRAPIGSVQKPIRRRPVAIVPRAQLTPHLAEGRIVLDLGDDRFWLLPRDLKGRTLLFTMRHGVSRVE